MGIEDERTEAEREDRDCLARSNSQAGANGDRNISFSLFSWPRAGLATKPVDTKSALRVCNGHIYHTVRHNPQTMQLSIAVYRQCVCVCVCVCVCMY